MDFSSEKFELDKFSSMKLLALALFLDPAQNGLFEGYVADAKYFESVIDVYYSASIRAPSEVASRVGETVSDAFCRYEKLYGCICWVR